MPADTVAAPKGNVRWTMIFMVFVMGAVSYLDRNNLSIVASGIKKDFGLDNNQLGYVFSSFALGYALAQPIAGKIADALGAYKTIAIAIVLWSVFTVATPLTSALGPAIALTALLIVRCLLGIGEAVIYPAGNRIVSSWIPKRERGFGTGVIFASVGVGGGICPPLVTYLMVTYGWHSAFYVSAVIGLLAGAAWLLIVRNTPKEHKSVTPEEASYIEAGLPPSSATDAVKIPWKYVVTDKQLLLLTASYFSFGYVAYIFFTWMFNYLSETRGLDLKASAFLTMLPFLAMMTFSTLGGIVSDALEKKYGPKIGRCVVAGCALIVASVFIAAATQVADAVSAGLIMAGGAGSLYVAQSAYWTLSANFGGKSAGAVSGFMNMGAQLGGVITASLTPVVATQYGWPASFLVASAVCLAGGVLWFLIDPNHGMRREASLSA
jgi:MFS transporter, ACS family, glucarate transporter